MKRKNLIKTSVFAVICVSIAFLLMTAIAADNEWSEPEAEEVVTEADGALEDKLIKEYAGMDDISEHRCRRVSENGIVYYSHYYPTQTILPATCTEDGYIDRVCEACGERELQVIPAYGHCMQDGVCIECGYTEGPAADDAEPEQAAPEQEPEDEQPAEAVEEPVQDAEEEKPETEGTESELE